MDLLKSRSFWCSLLLHGLAVGGIWGTTFLVTSTDEAGFRGMLQEEVADLPALEPLPLPEPEPEPEPVPPEQEEPQLEPVLLDEPEPPTPEWDPVDLTVRPSPHLLVRVREPEPEPTPPSATDQEDPPPDPVELPPVEETVEDAMAWVLEGPAPSYPRRASALRLAGTVVLLVTVDEQGRVSRIQVERSSGHGILDQAAERALQKWRFRVKEVRGTPTSYQARARFQFVHPDA